MITFQDNKKFLNDGAIGVAHREQSDLVIERTWNNDIAVKQCYLYDYFHDECPTLKDGMTYAGTQKIPVSVRFIISNHGSLSSDQVESHIMFKPSVERQLSNSYPVPYYSASFGGLAESPIGLYIDIPDNRGVYRRWMIVARDNELDYVKYSVLPCNYRFSWVKKNKTYQMWGIARLRNSYNSGIWSENITATVENQDQMWLPMNKYSKTIFYNQRLIVSDNLPEPVAWKCSKAETLHPFGIYKITLSQDKFDAKTDACIDNIWYADYYDSEVEKEPIDEDSYNIYLYPSANQFTIRAGVYTKDVTCMGLTGTHSYVWRVTLDDVDITEDVNIQANDNVATLQISNTDYIGDVITITVIIDGEQMAQIDMEVVA